MGTHWPIICLELQFFARKKETDKFRVWHLLGSSRISKSYLSEPNMKQNSQNISKWQNVHQIECSTFLLLFWFRWVFVYEWWICTKHEWNKVITLEKNFVFLLLIFILFARHLSLCTLRCSISAEHLFCDVWLVIFHWKFCNHERAVECCWDVGIWANPTIINQPKNNIMVFAERKYSV